LNIEVLELFYSLKDYLALFIRQCALRYTKE